MEYDLPKDPVILLSYVNTKLRDEYDSFAEFCDAKMYSKQEIEHKLGEIDYCYDEKKNQFI